MNEKQIQTLTWTAYEYEHKPKSNDWLWTLGLAAVIGSGLAIYFHNYLFAVFILISGFLLIYFKLNPPHEFNIEINNDGIKIDGEIHPYKTIKGFTVIEGEKAKLLVETTKYFLPVMTIPIPQYSANNIRATLLDVIPELELQESRSMMFADKLGL